MMWRLWSCTLLFCALVLGLAVLASDAQGQVANNQCTKEQDKQTTSGLTGTLTFTDSCGTQTGQWEMIVNGAPATVSVTINGVMPGGTASALTTSTSTSSTVLQTAGGPYSTYSIAYTLTGGTSPTLTFNRLATTAKSVNGFPSNPSFTGAGVNRACDVDGVVHKTINSCACYFANQGLSGGLVNTNYVETFGTNPFVCAGQKEQLTIYFGTGLAGTQCNTANPLCWVTNVPIVVPAGGDMIGTGIVTVGVGDPSGGTEIGFGTSYPAIVGAPAAPTVTCFNNGNGTWNTGQTGYFKTFYVNNLEGSDGATTAAYTNPSSEVSLAACGTNSEFTVTYPAAAGTSPFQAQDVGVASATASGAEVVNVGNSSDMTCGTGGGGTVGVVDSNQCKIAAACTTPFNPLSVGCFTVKSPGATTDSSHAVLQVIDETNAFLTVGGAQLTSTFGQLISRITMNCNNGAPSNVTPAANEPNIGIWMRNAQEAAYLTGAGVGGPCGGYASTPGAYLVISEPDGGVQGFNPGPGPNAGQFFDLIVEPLTSQNLTITATQSSFNLRTAGPGNTSGSIWVTGAGTLFTAVGVHNEDFDGGDGYRCDGGAAMTIVGGECVSTSATKGCFHRYSTCRYMSVTGAMNDNAVVKPTVVDDARGITITQPVGLAPMNYESLTYVQKNVLATAQSGISTATTITGMVFGVEAGATYQLDCALKYGASAATAAFNVNLTGPAAPTLLSWTLDGGTATNAFGTAGAATTYTALALPVDTGFASGNFPANVHLTLTNGTTAGSITVQAAASGTGTVSVAAGSECHLTPRGY